MGFRELRTATRLHIVTNHRVCSTATTDVLEGFPNHKLHRNIYWRTPLSFDLEFLETRKQHSPAAESTFMDTSSHLPFPGAQAFDTQSVKRPAILLQCGAPSPYSS